jgi:ABC-type antimicrobial peptide transport system permease subunit
VGGPHDGDLGSRLSTFTNLIGLITGFVPAIAAISLLVGGMGVRNIMLVSVTDRTGEIGTRKAVGATDGAILTQFAMEATTLGGFGGATAVVFVIGGGVAQHLVQAHGVVVHSTQVQLLFQFARVGDLVQMRVPAFEVAEERLDPGLVVRGGGPPGSGWRCGPRT